MRSPFLLGLCLATALAYPGLAQAQIIDHSNPSTARDDLVANQSYAWGPLFLGGLCRLTDKGTDETASVFSRDPVNITRFETSFVFQIHSGGPGDTSDGTGNCADGLTFTIQNQGVHALGGTGGSLGYAGILASVCVKFDTVPNAWEHAPDPSVSSTGFYALGETPAGGIDLLPDGINLRSQHPFRVDMKYDGRALQVRISDTTTGAASVQSYLVNIPKIIGSRTAFAGFTAATGFGSSAQDIHKWYFASPPLLSQHSRKSGVGRVQAAQRHPAPNTMVAAWPMGALPKVQATALRTVLLERGGRAP